MSRPALIWMVAILGLSGCSEHGVGSTGSLTELRSPAAPGSQLPRLSLAPDGTVWMSWVTEATGDAHTLRISALRGDEWSEPLVVAEGAGWFVNWADFPSLLAGSDQFMAAHWLEKRPGGTYAYDVMVSVSRDGGETWSPAFSPHDDGTATEHGFVSLFASEDGFGAVWLDGRNMAATQEQQASSHGHGSGGMTLRAALIDREGGVLKDTELDDLTCDCCQTGGAVTAAGPLVVYRDRDHQEIRDIYFAVYRDGSWTSGQPVARDRWKIAACPVNGPAIAARGDAAVTAWFTGAPGPAVRAAFYSDAAGRFAEPVAVDDGRPLGRVGTVLLEDGTAVVSWVAAISDELAAIRYRRIRPDGRLGPVRVLVEIPSARSSGFPQMITGGQGLVFAWTVPGERPEIRTATVAVPPGPGEDEDA